MRSGSFPESSSSSSSFVTTKWNYEVFLSFRGEDTRKNFTDHLYAALVQAGIRTFRDDDELPRGKRIFSQLVKAIHESRISIVVFSKEYASSRWCLDELVEIVKCMNTNAQAVLPIFYNVDPSDVRKQTGSYGEAFDKHEVRFKEEPKRVSRWREVLEEVGNLSGWDLQNMANGHEAKFIRKVVSEALRNLNKQFLDVAKHPVGVQSRANNGIAMLSVGTNDVRILGIYGMGGIGKTTIAKAMFNQLYDTYQGGCFLLNIKETSGQANGLVQLQEQLLSDVLKSKIPRFSNLDRGINVIKERLGCKKVIIVLDDVDQLKQVNALAGERDWFGPGSTIIITTRNEHLLTQLEVDEKYPVEELNRNESLQLFSLNAFKENQPGAEYLELANMVVEYLGGLPLALEVFGSSLFGLNVPEWRSAVEKLRSVPDHDIQKKLRISYDALEDAKLKDIFLDISCFFVGMDTDYVAKVLDGCGFFPEIGIRVLLNRSLLTIGPWNELRMHDLLREMGREIVREISPSHPGKWSRIWFYEDAWRILKNKTGTEAVEGLMFDVHASQEVFLSTETFTKMTSLRLLRIDGVHLSGNFEYLSKDLKWLCWRHCALKSLPLNFDLDTLTVLDLQYSKIEEVWKEIKFLNRLKTLDLSHCVHLVKTPNFMGLASLERLLLLHCTNLCEVHQSIGQLERLVLLNLKGCKRLKNLPNSICCLTSLQILNITDCSKLEKLPEDIGKLGMMTELLASGTGIQELPSSIRNLQSLSIGGSEVEAVSTTSLCSLVSSCFLRKNMNSKTTIPAYLTELSSLTKLEMNNRGLSDVSFSCNLGSLSSLRNLSLEGNDFVNLPTSISKLSKVEYLFLKSCSNLQSISELPPNLCYLHAEDCTSLKSLSVYSDNRPMLSLSGCEGLVDIQGLDKGEQGSIIHMERCNSLSTSSRNNLLQSILRGGFTAATLPGNDIPDWFSYQVVGSSLSFQLPTEEVLVGRQVKGLMVWVVYAGIRGCAFVFPIIRNKNTGDQFSFLRETVPIYASQQDHSRVIHVPFDMRRCAMKGGEELELSFIFVRPYFASCAEFVVKKCGVHLITKEAEGNVIQGVDLPHTSPSYPKLVRQLKLFEGFFENVDSDWMSCYDIDFLCPLDNESSSSSSPQS
ncbi:hypothetical protein K2173_011598 [Erythroxylum novogranatense]|uniref:ADP-ribosyl cyclase/cyclic ADP-ribose hydrolase n=1 Tax=Erythroxylum novogranatense TaxID=1862640 RepID=A0AAV8U841_9ROSI|nr:hypothetical protein K2173_011598 [Erythroxylum novogranatense]